MVWAMTTLIVTFSYQVLYNRFSTVTLTKNKLYYHKETLKNNINKKYTMHKLSTTLIKSYEL